VPLNIGRSLKMPKIRLHILIALLLTLLLYSNYSIGAEEDEKTQQLASDENQKPKTPNWSFSIDLDSENSIADQIQQIQISDSNVPVLQYRAKGRKERGTILFLTAQEESPSSKRLASPLSIQLSQLGWEVIVPAIPKAEFKRDTNKENENDSVETGSSTQAAENSSAGAQTGTNKETPDIPPEEDSTALLYFDTAGQYQDWIDQTIGESLKLRKSTSSTIVVIANQNSAYWILDSTPKYSNITQIVFISPQIPENVSTEIEEKIQRQNLPLYVFSENNDLKNIFNRVLEQNFWNASNIRINRQQTPNRQFDLENPILARKISGWIDSQNRSKN